MKLDPLAVQVERRILLIRQQKVMLDYDLASLYGVETRALKQAVRRNRGRFPDDFMFTLTNEETSALVSQYVIPGRVQTRWRRTVRFHGARRSYALKRAAQPAGCFHIKEDTIPYRARMQLRTR